MMPPLSISVDAAQLERAEPMRAARVVTASHAHHGVLATFRSLLDWPIRPMRQALPLKGPRPAPISIPNSSSSRRRTLASSAPSGM